MALDKKVKQISNYYLKTKKGIIILMTYYHIKTEKK